MKMADGIDFKISEGLIKPIIEAKISAAIVEAMGGHERMIAEMVAGFLNQNVDNEGKVSGYSSNKPRLSWLVHKMLEDAMKSALTAFLEKKKGILEKEFEKFFASKAGSSKVIAAMQDGFCAALKDKWRTTIVFQPPS
jgi:ABC-type phosphate/phosphonate transport system substrate-binding protein